MPRVQLAPKLERTWLPFLDREDPLLAQPPRSQRRGGDAGWSQRKQTVVFVIVVVCVLLAIALVGSLLRDTPTTSDFPVQGPAPEQAVDY